MADALDWYFKIDDLRGGTEDRVDQTWFDVASWNTSPSIHKINPGRPHYLTVYMVTGLARANLLSAMQTRRKFIQAKIESGREYHPFVELRVLSIKPAGHHRNMKPLDEVTFEVNSPGR